MQRRTGRSASPGATPSGAPSDVAPPCRPIAAAAASCGAQIRPYVWPSSSALALEDWQGRSTLKHRFRMSDPGIPFVVGENPRRRLWARPLGKRSGWRCRPISSLTRDTGGRGTLVRGLHALGPRAYRLHAVGHNRSWATVTRTPQRHINLWAKISGRIQRRARGPRSPICQPPKIPAAALARAAPSSWPVLRRCLVAVPGPNLETGPSIACATRVRK